MRRFWGKIGLLWGTGGLTRGCKQREVAVLKKMRGTFGMRTSTMRCCEGRGIWIEGSDEANGVKNERSGS